MVKKSRWRSVRHEAPDQPAATADTPAPDQPAARPQTPTAEYAALGPDAPIAWPSGARRVPVTGKLPPHAAAALERMGITKSSK